MRRPASSTQVVESGLSDFESDDQVQMVRCHFTRPPLPWFNGLLLLPLKPPYPPRTLRPVVVHTQLEKGSSGEEDDGPREPVRKGTLSKDIQSLPPMAGYSMKTLMARINFVAIIFAVQVPVVVFIATMTDLLHPLSGFMAAGSFALSILIWIYKACRSSMAKDKDSQQGIVMVSFGLYITAPCCITSSLLYYFSTAHAAIGS